MGMWTMKQYHQHQSSAVHSYDTNLSHLFFQKLYSVELTLNGLCHAIAHCNDKVSCVYIVAHCTIDAFKAHLILAETLNKFRWHYPIMSRIKFNCWSFSVSTMADKYDLTSPQGEKWTTTKMLQHLILVEDGFNVIFLSLWIAILQQW